MSARAAWRLETLGFRRVYRYEAGKAYWFASDLPAEGEAAAIPRAGEAARRDIPTCQLRDRVGDAARAAEDAGADVCLVVNEERVLLGRLAGDALSAHPDTPAEQVMEPGPSTIRPDVTLAEITERLHEHQAKSVIVTDPDGRLIGILYQDEADRMLQVEHARHVEQHG